ncbi:hypothetical protein [Roseivivax sediminis]|uniref:Uncharacterized protein n=1 Tax=Roseivivax sediminis TaxID=936889 RepID=A0A1I1WGA7_9RHOB|nr:hypothetical protein [Roseivivax sediminis]SFD94051.1 hypothetical protein SAMN04515678_104300 [Roseivivax sediminis]
MTRRLLSFLLGLWLALASVEMAVARGLPPPAGEVVLCRGLAVVTVTLDAEGDPVRHSQLCPDAAAALLGAPVGPPVLPAPMALPRRMARPPEAGSVTCRAGLPPRARGPPRASFETRASRTT